MYVTVNWKKTGENHWYYLGHYKVMPTYSVLAWRSSVKNAANNGWWINSYSRWDHVTHCCGSELNVPYAADVRCSGCQSFTLTHAESYSVSLTVVSLRITYLHGTELLIEARTMTCGESTCLANSKLTLHVTVVLTLHRQDVAHILRPNVESAFNPQQPALSW